jgi:hypothetical protein
VHRVGADAREGHHKRHENRNRRASPNPEPSCSRSCRGRPL